MITPYYRTFASDSTNLREFTKMMLYVIEYTVTSNKDGGRGSFFKTLITEKLPRKIQETISTCLYNFIKIETDHSPEDPIVRDIYRENRPFGLRQFYTNVVQVGNTVGRENFVLLDGLDLGVPVVEWFHDVFNIEQIKNFDTNLFTPNWSRDMFENMYPEIPSAWERKEKQGGFRLSQHAPSKLKNLIQTSIQPQRQTIYFLLAIYKELGFLLDHTCKISFSVYDAIGPRLEAFARVYLGTVLRSYFQVNKDGELTQRGDLMESLKHRLVLYRGNPHETKIGLQATTRRNTGIIKKYNVSTMIFVYLHCFVCIYIVFCVFTLILVYFQCFNFINFSIDRFQD